MWPILFQCELVCKVQKVLSSLPLQDSLNYEVPKRLILCANELEPEIHRQKFRTHRKLSGQTFVQFVHEKGVIFNKWDATSEVKDNFALLCQLILLEDLKNLKL